MQVDVSKPLSLKEILGIPGAKEVMISIFCYCALEQTASLWVSSYLVFYHKMPEDAAARFASLFFVGITVGRFLRGFLTMKFNDKQMIWLGEAITLVGILTLFLPFGKAAVIPELILVGLGCAPIYPCIIHSTPANFGAERSQAMIGVQMAFAYIGICVMPPIFGLIANHISISLFPVYMLLILAVMAVMYQRMLGKVKNR